MIRLPPRSTRTDSLVPWPPPFRSPLGQAQVARKQHRLSSDRFEPQRAGRARADMVAAREPRIVELRADVHRITIGGGKTDIAARLKAAVAGGRGQLVDLEPVAGKAAADDHEIGRASCRERVCKYV